MTMTAAPPGEGYCPTSAPCPTLETWMIFAADDDVPAFSIQDTNTMRLAQHFGVVALGGADVDTTIYEIIRRYMAIEGDYLLLLANIHEIHNQSNQTTD